MVVPAIDLSSVILIPDLIFKRLNFSHPSSFQTNLISLESLHKVIDPTQLTPDLEGNLHYDHPVWIELRCVSTVLHTTNVVILYRICTQINVKL